MLSLDGKSLLQLLRRYSDIECSARYDHKRMPRSFSCMHSAVVLKTDSAFCCLTVIASVSMEQT